MSAYVKIKRSKNLRFKLISLMYLVFLMLSLIQIPTDWLASNSFVYPYLNYSNQQNEFLIGIENRLNAIEPKMQIALGYDTLSKSIKEPNTFAPTDLYFIKGGASDSVFKILLDLNDWVYTINSDAGIVQNYETLFAEDLKNGLKNNNPKTWKNWKWKHIPVTMALNLFEELKLRVSLMSSKLITKQITENTPDINDQIASNDDDSRLVLLSENGKLSIGETLKFHLYQDSLLSLKITKNKQLIENNHVFNLDTVLFTPSETGKYTIEISGQKLHETFDINVTPAVLVPENKSTLRIAYKGINYTQSIPISIENASLYVNGTNKGKLLASKKINYTPTQIGWNKLEVKSAQQLVLSDSIYVKPLPEPYIFIKDLPNLSISKKRFQQIKKIEVYAMHPSFDENTFEIESYDITIPGTNYKNLKVNSSIFQQEDIFSNDKISFIIISNVHIKQGNEIKNFPDPIVVKIL